MHLRRSISQAQISGIARSLRDGTGPLRGGTGLGELGDAVVETFGPLSAYGKSREFYAGGKTFTVYGVKQPGYVPTRYNNNAPASIVYHPLDIIYQALIALPAPSVYRDFAGAPTYGTLPNKDIVLFGNDAWPNPTPQPHYVKLADGSKILSIGNPTSSRDPIEFLRAALMSRDWSAVGYWYSFWANSIYQATGVQLNPWHGLSQFNVNDYYYTNDAGRHQFTFDDYDLGCFCREVWRKFLPWQNNSHSSEIAGLGYPGNTPSDIQKYSPHADIVDFACAWFNYSDYANGSNYEGRNRNLLRIGWVPDSSTTIGDYLGTIVTTIAIAIVTWGAGTALGAAGGGTASGAGGIATGGAAGGAVGGAVTAGSVIADAALLPEVVVTATTASGVSAGAIAAGAGLVGGAISAGSIVTTTTPPALSAPNLDATLLPEVIVTAAPAGGVSAGTVGAALAAGAVAATTVAPAISPATSATSTLPDESMLQEVTVTAKPPAPLPVAEISAGLATGLVDVATITDIVNPTPNLSVDTSVNHTGTWQDKLQALIKKYGIDYVKSHLGQLLSQIFGRKPTPQEQQQVQDELNGFSTAAPWLVGGIFLAAIIIASTGKIKK
jgi:hypothetical protein